MKKIIVSLASLLFAAFFFSPANAFADTSSVTHNVEKALQYGHVFAQCNDYRQVTARTNANNSGQWCSCFMKRNGDGKLVSVTATSTTWQFNYGHTTDFTLTNHTHSGSSGLMYRSAADTE